MANTFINPKYPVHVSYSWNYDEEVKKYAKNCMLEYIREKYGDIAGVDDKIEKVLSFDIEHDFEILRNDFGIASIQCVFDKGTGISEGTNYGASISDFERTLGKDDIVLLFISYKSLMSKHCLHELHCIIQNNSKYDRVIPIMLQDIYSIELNGTKINLGKDYFVWYVNRMFDSLNDKKYSDLTTTDKVLMDSKPVDSINLLFNELLADSKILTVDLEKLHEQQDDSKFNEDLHKALVVVVEAARKLIIKLEGKDNNGQTPQAPKFYFPLVKNLIKRDTEVEKLYELVSKDQFSNLYGLGGSGKSSLVNLLVEKHKDEFNQIACVVVNDNIEETFVNKINETIKLDLDGVKDRCVAVLSYLREHYESGKPNLMVLDVNSMDWQDVMDFVDKLNNNYFEYINGWHFLIISREFFSEGMSSMELSADDDSNNDFLKELFLRKAGKSYNYFQDFDKLFTILYHNPLLVELLGIKLKNKHKHSLEEIKKILGDSKYYEGTTKGGSVNPKGKKEKEQILIGYLCNLVSYEGLREDEKNLVRHFVIWPTDYIDKEVIKKLLDGIFESDEVLTTILDNLQSRGLLSLEENDGKLKYKLHGLIAESVRKQIEIEFSDYLQYNDNVSDIIELDYWSFVPFAECIGHSYSNYDIYGIDEFLFSIAVKLQESFIAHWASALYQKVIDIIKCKVEKEPDNPEYQNDLASAYNNLANMQKDYLNDYASAEENYKKAISIMERLPENNPEYQNDLASAYNNLATMQCDNLNDYASAEENYKNAISIRERLPENNPEYQNDLASAYNNLAVMQRMNLNDYVSAEENYKKAISIMERLPEDNPEYQNNLASAYNNLANMQCDNLNDYASAVENYKKAISIRERLPENNPEYQNDLASAYNNLANMQCDNLNDYASAGENYKKAISIRDRLPENNPKYQNDLASAYNNLAFFQKENLSDIDSAIVSMKRAVNIWSNWKNCSLQFMIMWLERSLELALFYYEANKYEDFFVTIQEIVPIALECKEAYPENERVQNVAGIIMKVLDLLNRESEGD